jgi:predicted Ser/Thr protein kinase
MNSPGSAPKMDSAFEFSGEYVDHSSEQGMSRTEKSRNLILDMRAPNIEVEEMAPIREDEVKTLIHRIDIWSNIEWTSKCYVQLRFVGPDLAGVGTLLHLISIANTWRLPSGNLLVSFHRLFSIVPDFVGENPRDYVPIAAYLKCVEDYYGESMRYGENLTYLRRPFGSQAGSVSWMRQATASPHMPLAAVMEVLRLDLLGVEELYAGRLVAGDATQPKSASERLRLGRSLSRIERQNFRSSYRLDIERHLGAGGVGELYLAKEPDGNSVAVKVMAPDQRFDITDKGIELFEEEIRLLKGVSKMEIAPEVLKDGVCFGRRFFVQEFFPWPNMRRWVEEMSPTTSGRIDALSALVEAVSKMHGSGIVHRDLTPKNVLVDPQSFDVRLIDFGVALDLNVDRTGKPILRRVGSLRYSAPEVRDSPAAASAASDAFSLGMMIYELFLEKHVAGIVPPLRTLVPAVPEWLSEFARLAMNYLPSDRLLPVNCRS